MTTNQDALTPEEAAEYQLTDEEAANLPYADRVQAGIALLDSLLPEWHTLVNPETLIITDCFLCIVGQIEIALEQQLGDDVAQVFVRSVIEKTGELYSVAYGFALAPTDYQFQSDESYSYFYETTKLQETWLALAFNQL